MATQQVLVNAGKWIAASLCAIHCIALPFMGSIIPLLELGSDHHGHHHHSHVEYEWLFWALSAAVAAWYAKSNAGFLRMYFVGAILAGLVGLITGMHGLQHVGYFGILIGMVFVLGRSVVRHRRGTHALCSHG